MGQSDLPDDIRSGRLYGRASMKGLRTILCGHRALAALALALLLSVKLLIPAGFMISTDAKVLTVVICSGVTGEHQTAQLAIPQGSQKPGQGNGHEQGKNDPCPYSSLSMASLSGADTPLLAIALAFILALGFAPVRAVAPRSSFRFLPPSCGPPTVA